MKFRIGLMAIAAAAVSAAALSAAVPAFAMQTDQFYVTDSSGNHWYMMTKESTGSPTLEVEEHASNSHYQNVYGTSWVGLPGRPVYEWKDTANGLCWTYTGGTSMDESACSPPPRQKTTQLFWQTTAGAFVNEAATDSGGTNFCVNASHATPNAGINIIACKSRSQPGGFDQYWTSQNLS